MRSAKPQHPRIIGGRWRGRRLGKIAPSTRPTPDRVRETVFNWLAPYLAGCRCLDLFAGSGALGLEALSRGAAYSLLIEADPKAAQRIGASIARLEVASQAQVLCRNACDWLRQPLEEHRFDLVFLDPPYASGLLAPCCAALAHSGLLHDSALVYTECEKGEIPDAPANWHRLRAQCAGRVYYALYQCGARTVSAPL